MVVLERQGHGNWVRGFGGYEEGKYASKHLLGRSSTSRLVKSIEKRERNTSTLTLSFDRTHPRSGRIFWNKDSRGKVRKWRSKAITDALYIYAPAERSVDSWYLHAKTRMSRSAEQTRGHAFSFPLFLGERICSGLLIINKDTKHKVRHENTVYVFWKNIDSLLMVFRVLRRR